MAGPRMDFALVRERSDFSTILTHYNIAHERRQNQITVLCPFHDDRRPSLSVNLERKLFHCFACQAKGDILDFVTMIEKVSLPEAARIVAECCSVPLDQQRSTHAQSPKTVPDRNDRSSWQNCSREVRHHDDDADLSSRIALDPTHPYLFDRGLTPELIESFGLGYYPQGRLRGRICIPIHTPDGTQVLAYCGRWANDAVPDGTPRYLMPRGFKKSELLFNYHRAAGAQHLVIVEGYWSVFRLQALNVPTVALMGTSLSDIQMELLLRSGARQLTLLLDADQAGRQATTILLPRLSSSFFVRTPILPDDQSPDTVCQDLLLAAVRL